MPVGMLVPHCRTNARAHTTHRQEEREGDKKREREREGHTETGGLLDFHLELLPSRLLSPATHSDVDATNPLSLALSLLSDTSDSLSSPLDSLEWRSSCLIRRLIRRPGHEYNKLSWMAWLCSFPSGLSGSAKRYQIAKDCIRVQSCHAAVTRLSFGLAF